MTVSQDSTKLWWLPASSTEWTELLMGDLVPNPHSLYPMQEASSHFVDVIGSATSTSESGISYQQTATNFTRKGAKCTTDNGTGAVIIPTPAANANSLTFLHVLQLGTNPGSGERAICCAGITQFEEAQIVNGPKIRAHSGGSTNDDANVQSGDIIVITKYDFTNSALKVYVNDGSSVSPGVFTLQNADVTSYLLGDAFHSTDSICVYAAMWTGSDAELSDAQVAKLFDRIENGPAVAAQPSASVQFVVKSIPLKIADASITVIGGEDIALKDDFDETPAGDWSVVAGVPAAYQSVVRDTLNPTGSLPRRKDWGASVGALVFKNATKDNRDLAVSKTTARLRKNRRIRKILEVSASPASVSPGIELRVRADSVDGPMVVTITNTPITRLS